MADEQKAPDSAEQKPDGNQAEVKMIPRSEAEIAFKARDEYKAKFNALEAQVNKSKEEELAKQGDFKTLLEQKEKELAEKSARLESALKAESELEVLKKTERETIKKAMGDKWKDSFDTLEIGVLKDMLQFVPSGKDGSPHSPANAGSGQQKAYKDMTVDELVKARQSGQPMRLVTSN